MIRWILIACGLGAAFVGTWRGYENARQAIAGLAEAGDPTRAALDARRPLVARSRVRRFVRGAATSVVWLAIAMYGLFLIASASVLGAGVP